MLKHGYGNAGEMKTKHKEERVSGEEARNLQNSHPDTGNSQDLHKENVKPQDCNTAQADSANAGCMSPEEKMAAIENELATQAQAAAELELKLADLNDQLLRKAADFENFRKRMNREKQELTDFANQNLLLDLLPVIDDFERAIKSAETSKDFSSFYEGVTMIEKHLTTQLENKWGLKRFDSAGMPFDPNHHEAIQMEKAEGITEAIVKDDYLKGYFLKDRVIRFAKVKVLMPLDGGNAAPSEDGGH